MSNNKMVSTGISNYIHATFNVKCNHPSSRFNATDRDVTGNITLDFINRLDSVHSIEYGLMGSYEISLNDAQTRFNGKTTEIIRNKIFKKQELFDIVNQVNDFAKNKYHSYKFKKNEHVEIPIKITFPIEKGYFPSSTSGFGSDIDNQGLLYVYYTLYLKITRKTSTFGKPTVDYIDFPLTFQAHASYFEEGPKNYLVEFSDTKIFQIRNSKPLALNNTDTISHTHNENSTELPKAVDLTVWIKLPRLFDFRVSAFSQLWFELETGYNCDMIHDSKSGLDGFEIQAIEFIVHSKSISTVEGRTYEDEQDTTVFKLTELDLNFNIHDFRYYPTRQKFALSLGGKPLVDKTSSKSAMEFMGSQTFIPTCKLNHWFENVSHLNIILTISDGSNCPQEFEYFTSVSPDLLNLGILQFTKMDLKSLFDEEHVESSGSSILPSYNELPEEIKTEQSSIFRDQKIPNDDPPAYAG